MRPLFAARVHIALGLIATTILTVSAVLHLRHHRADAPDTPAAPREDAAPPPGESALAAPRPGVAPGPLRLEGRVIDDRHQPVRHARLTLNGARTATSTIDGRFAFEGVAPGDYVVTAERGMAYGDTSTTLSDSSEPVEIRMYIGPTVALHVVDRAGVPVVGARVMALGNVDAFTDQDGTVTRRYEPGRTLFQVQAPGLASRDVWDVLGEDPRDLVDRRVVLGPTAPIGGIAIDQDGAPVAEAQVEVKQIDGSWSDVTRTDDQGQWRLDGFGAGTLRIEASVGIGSPSTRPLVEFDARAPRFGLVVAVDRGATLGLAEHHAVPAHPGDQHVALVLPDAGRITGRVVLDGRPVPFFGVAPGPTLGPEPSHAPDGRFELEVQPVTEQPESRTIALVGPGFQRLVLGDVPVVPGQTTDLGDIAVSAGASLRGRVVTASGAPVAGAAVVVHIRNWPDIEVTLSAENADVRGARSDASGRFEIAGLPDDLAGLEIEAQHPDIGQALPRALTAADLAGDVEIALAPTGDVLGTVIGDAPGERHRILAVSRADGRAVTTETSDGAFWIPRLPAGDYAVSFDAKYDPEIVAPPVPLHVAAGRTTPLALPRAAAQVGIDLTTDEECVRVLVDPADAVEADGAIASRPCNDHHHGSVERVTPGRYRICNQGSGCAVVDVAPAPARQRATLGGR